MRGVPGVMFLTYSDLVEMTGYRSPRKMADWLAANGYEFDVRSDGRPNVLREQVLERQCKRAQTPARPNLGAIDD